MMGEFLENHHIKYLNEKGRFLLFALSLLLILFLAFFLLKIAYARYEMSSKIVASIDKALYIFDSDEVQFNIHPDKIIPSDEPYTYNFSVSNYNETKNSDVDLYYHITVRTTTNLPITIKLYRNEDYEDPNATNIFSEAEDVQDSDGAWYHIYDVAEEYNMYYTNETTDVYTLVIDFPSTYAADETYVNTIENIEVTLKSRQIL